MSQFTKTPPSDKGWYWWRHNERDVPQVYYVDWGAIKGESCLMYWQARSNMPNPVDEYGEWCPIKVPDGVCCEQRDDCVVEIFGPDNKVHYRRPANHPTVLEALSTTGYYVQCPRCKGDLISPPEVIGVRCSKCGFASAGGQG